MSDLILHAKDFNSYKEIKIKSITKSISNLSSEKINNEVYKDLIFKTSLFDNLEILEHEIIGSHEKVEREFNDDFGFRRKKNMFKYFVRFKIIGEIDLLNYRPSRLTHNTWISDASFNKFENSVDCYIYLNQLNKEEYNKIISIINETLNCNIHNLNNDIENFNREIKETIERELEKRKEELINIEQFEEEIGINTNKNIELNKKEIKINEKLVPKLPSKKEIKNNIEKLPYITNDVYIDILNTMSYVGSAFERKPSLYKGKSEEELRDMFLLFLETRYEFATATGETFNHKGKTDILIKYSETGENVFIAECKIWKGDTIDKDIEQLYGYLSYRDTKTALVYFVKNKNITDVIKKANNEITKNSFYLKEGKHVRQNSYNYKFKLKNNEGEIQLELMFFHFNIE